MRRSLVVLGTVVMACGVSGEVAPPLPPWLTVSQLQGPWVLRLRGDRDSCAGTYTLLLEIRTAMLDRERYGVVLAETDSNTWRDSLSGQSGPVSGFVQVFRSSDSLARVSWFLYGTTGPQSPAAAEVAGWMAPDLSVRGVVLDPLLPESGPPYAPLLSAVELCTYALEGNHG